MAEFSFPFASVAGDRKYSADEWAQYFNYVLTNGVFPVGTQLQVTAGEGMDVVVSAGQANINGYRYRNTSDLTLTLDAADGVLDRIDLVVVRWDKTEREITCLIQKGTPAGTPAAPSLVRDTDFYELGLAEISVPAGVTSILTAHITDTRLDPDVCGIVSSLITPDTTGWYDAWEAEWLAWQTEQYNDFTVWLASIEALIEGDTAAQLAAAIADLQTDKADAIHASQHASNGADPISAEDIGASAAKTQTTDTTNTTSTIAEVADNTEYLYTQALTAFTITAYPATAYECYIRFTTGSSITCSFPATTKWVGGVAPVFAASKTYEISIRDGLAVWGEF